MMLMMGSAWWQPRSPSPKPGLILLRDMAAGRVPPPAAPNGQSGPYIFQDEFDGPAGSAPDPSKWTWHWRASKSRIRRSGNDPRTSAVPDDRRNVFVDGTSNLVFACHERRQHVLRRQGSKFLAGRSRPHLGSRIKLNCLTAGAWPPYWLGNQDEGEIDVMEWYGNGKWPSAPPFTRKRTAANGRRTTSRWMAPAHVANPVG